MDARPEKGSPPRSAAHGQAAAKALRLVGGVAAALAWSVVIAWLLGRILIDRFAWSQPLWWMPTLLVIPAAFLGLIASLRPGSRTKRKRVRRVAVWMVVTLFVLAWFFLVENRFLAAPGDSTEGLTIAHWNLSHPGSDDREAFSDAARAIDADVLILSSFAHRHVPEGVVREDESRRASAFGIFAVITDLEILGHRPLVNRVDDRIWSYMIELDATEQLGRPIIIYLIDLPAIDWRSPMNIVTDGRMQVAARLRELLDRAGAPPPDVVIGDFNMPRGSASIDHAFPAMHHAYSDGGHGFSATFRRDWPLVHIDHTLLSSEWAAQRYDVIDPGIGRHMAQRTRIVPSAEE